MIDIFHKTTKKKCAIYRPFTLTNKPQKALKMSVTNLENYSPAADAVKNAVTTKVPHMRASVRLETV